MEKYKIIIVDDHEVFRMGLKLLLQMIKGVKVVGEAANGKQFLECIDKNDFDLVFMDINMPVMNGVIATEKALAKYPDMKIVALTTYGDNENFDKMIFAGVEGFMLKNSGFNEFKSAIEKVTNGGNYFSEELLKNFTKEIITNKIKEKFALPEFTSREHEILKLICKGYSNEQIGEKLFISSRTVEKHKSNLLCKTNSNNTVNLVLFAFKHKIAG